jgi:hypothetical protein
MDFIRNACGLYLRASMVGKFKTCKLRDQPKPEVRRHTSNGELIPAAHLVNGSSETCFSNSVQAVYAAASFEVCCLSNSCLQMSNCNARSNALTPAAF